MAGLDPKPKKPTPPRQAGNIQRKPLQVMHISRKTEEELTNEKSFIKEAPKDIKEKSFEKKVLTEKITSPIRRGAQEIKDFRLDENKDEFETMDVLGATGLKRYGGKVTGSVSGSVSSGVQESSRTRLAAADVTAFRSTWRATSEIIASTAASARRPCSAQPPTQRRGGHRTLLPSP